MKARVGAEGLVGGSISEVKGWKPGQDGSRGDGESDGLYRT